MSFHVGNVRFSGSAGQPAYLVFDSTIGRRCTGWDNEYHSDDRNAVYSARHSDDSSAQRPAGELNMIKGVSLKWTTCPSKWKDNSPICAEHLHAAPLMQVLATSRNTFREIPWRGILEHVLTTAATHMRIPFDAPNLISAVVETSGTSTVDRLASYLHDWRASSERVRAVLDWHFSPKEMCERSRPGAYLADCMITELKVREHGSRSSVHYHVVGNGEYQAMGHEMGIVQDGNSSANNVGNQLECLCWVAFEEDRPLWIIALVWHAVQLEQKKKRKPAATVIVPTESDSDAHPVHETESDSGDHPAAIMLVTESDSGDTLQPTAITAEHDFQKSACGANPEPYKSDPKSAAQPLSHSDVHPVSFTLPTPLWDRFIENLQLASGGESGRDFVNFISNHCFKDDHFFKDPYGQPVETRIPLAVKMESLFQTAWRRRKLVLERLRQNGMMINDETYELSDDDMRTLSQLQSPVRFTLIVCAMGGGLAHKTVLKIWNLKQQS